MKEELMKQLGDLAELTKDGIIKGAEVLQVEMPLLVEQILQWKFILHTIWGIISLIVLLSLVPVIIHFKKDDHSDGFEFFVCLVSLIPLIAFIGCLITTIKIAIAPKLFLVEYISRLMQ